MSFGVFCGISDLVMLVFGFIADIQAAKQRKLDRDYHDLKWHKRTF